MTDTSPGEWLEYSIMTKSTKDYSISINYSAKTDGKIRLSLNQKIIADQIILPKTKNAEITTYDVAKSVILPEGINFLRINIINGSMNLDSIKFN